MLFRFDVACVCQLCWPVYETSSALEKASGELPSDHGGRLDRTAGLFVEPVESGRDHILDRVRHLDRPDRDDQLEVRVLAPDGAGLQQRSGHLLDEERVAVGLGQNDLGVLRREPDGSDQRAGQLRAFVIG